MVKGFKKFLLRGNIVDLAVAVAIGTAFTAMVTAFGNAFIKPLVALAGGGGLSGGTFTVRGQVFSYSLFVNAVIIFMITAAVIYFALVVPLEKLMARVKDRQKTSSEVDEAELALLTEIRDLLRERQSS